MKIISSKNAITLLVFAVLFFACSLLIREESPSLSILTISISAMLFCCFLFNIFFVARLNIKKNRRKNKLQKRGDVPQKVEFLIISEITVSNNHTDCKYQYKTVNDFGLSISQYVDCAKIRVEQMTGVGTNSNQNLLIAILYDYSVVEVKEEKKC